MSAIRCEDKDRRLTTHTWDWLYVLLISLPAALLGATLVSDVLYWLTAAAICARASEWLLGAGLACGLIAAADALVRYLSVGKVRPSKACWIHVIGNVLALLLSATNLIYRLNEDTTSAVVPAGITLTSIVVCLLMATAYLGRGLEPEVPDDDADDWDLF
jgi:uncharacterized membrane protein